MIVVLDCNIWISLTINKQIDFIADLSDNGIVIASCVILRNEIVDVLQRPRLNKFIDKESVKKVVDLHDLITSRHIIGEISNVVDDPKDNYLFALSLKSKADFLVTGDRLLLMVDFYKKTKMISLADFRKIFDNDFNKI